jgi:hypothetical protein
VRSRTVDDAHTSFDFAEGRNASADVHADAARSFRCDLHLSRVHAGSDREPDRCDTLLDRLRTSDRARGAIERGEEAVTGGVSLVTSEAIDLAADDVVVSALHLAPRPIPDPGRPVGGADDIGEQDGREDAFQPGCEWLPVRNPSISSRAAPHRRTRADGRPAISTNVAFGMCSATYLGLRTSTDVDGRSVPWTTSVGTRIDGSTFLTSVTLYFNASAAPAPALCD